MVEVDDDEDDEWELGKRMKDMNFRTEVFKSVTDEKEEVNDGVNATKEEVELEDVKGKG